MRPCSCLESLSGLVPESSPRQRGRERKGEPCHVGPACSCSRMRSSCGLRFAASPLVISAGMPLQTWCLALQDLAAAVLGQLLISSPVHAWTSCLLAHAHASSADRAPQAPRANNGCHTCAPAVSHLVSPAQAASGAGQAAMDELWHQTREVIDGKPPTTQIFPYQVHTGPAQRAGGCSDWAACLAVHRKPDRLHRQLVRAVTPARQPVSDVPVASCVAVAACKAAQHAGSARHTGTARPAQVLHLPGLCASTASLTHPAVALEGSTSGEPAKAQAAVPARRHLCTPPHAADMSRARSTPSTCSATTRPCAPTGTTRRRTR